MHLGLSLSFTIIYLCFVPHRIHPQEYFCKIVPGKFIFKKEIFFLYHFSKSLQIKFQWVSLCPKFNLELETMTLEKYLLWCDNRLS
jgi:hypothetical protein